MNSRTRDSFYMLWTLAILICLVVCVVVLAYVSIVPGPAVADVQPAGDVGAQGADQQPADASGVVPEQPAPTEEPAPAPAPASVTLAETEDMGMDYQDRIVFLGDSTTYGLYSYSLLPHWQVWTPSSGTLSLFNWAIETIEYYAPGYSVDPQTLSIADCAAAGRPEYLVITLGINGITILDEAGFKGYYSGLIQAIRQASPSTKIICNSIYPVIDSKAPEGINNAKIDAANGWIRDVAAQEGVAYLNSHDALTDAGGGLSGDYISPASDGIHMDASGYEALLQYVRTHAWQ